MPDSPVSESPLRCTCGQRGEIHAVITDADTAAALGSGDVQVLGTPRLLAWLERATCVAVAGYVDAHWTTVGAHVELDHLAPSHVGESISCAAEITAVDGRRLTFTVTAHSQQTLIARGTVHRVAVRRSQVE